LGRLGLRHLRLGKLLFREVSHRNSLAGLLLKEVKIRLLDEPSRAEAVTPEDTRGVTWSILLQAHLCILQLGLNPLFILFSGLGAGGLRHLGFRHSKVFAWTLEVV